MQDRFDTLSKRLKDSHIPVIIFDMEHESQRVLLKRDLRVRELREMLVSKFIEGATNISEYAVFYENRPLGLNETLEQLAPFARLQLGRVDRQQAPQDRLVLKVDPDIEFVIQRLPAVIGRSKQGQSVDVNLNDLPDALTVSRRHATILQQNGNYYIQNITEGSDKPLYINDQVITSQLMKELNNNDKIRLGKITLSFYIHSS